MKASELASRHRKRHKRASREIRAAIRPFFLAQTQWLIDGINTDEPLVPEAIGVGYDPVVAHESLISSMAVVYDVAERIASDTFKQYSQPVILDTKFFGILKSIIKFIVDKLLSADWWHDVASGAVNAAKSILQATIDKSGPVSLSDAAEVKAKLATKLRKLTKHRVNTIGDVEANGAINIGTHAAAKSLEMTTEETNEKTWVTMADERVRPTHVALHMTSVHVDAMFNVGGFPSPHPGYWELPIQERIHCRCFLAFGGVEDDISFPIPEKLREAI